MFKSLLRQSWQIVWQNPVLWLFGLFNTFLIGNEINLLVNNFNRLSNNLNLLLGAKALGQSMPSLEFLKVLFSQSALTNIIIIFIPALILFCLAVISQISLIKGTQIAQDGQKIAFNQLVKVSWPHFGPIFLLNLINLILIYLLFLLFGLPFAHLFLKFGQAIWFLIYFILSLIILLPLSLIVSFVARFAIINQVLSPESLLLSLKKSFFFFIKNWLKTIWLAIFLAIIGLGVGLCLFILAITAVTPFLILTNFFYYLKISAGFWLMFGLGLSLVFFLFCFLGSIFSAFQSVVWTLFVLWKKSE